MKKKNKNNLAKRVHRDHDHDTVETICCWSER